MAHNGKGSMSEDNAPVEGGKTWFAEFGIESEDKAIEILRDYKKSLTELKPYKSEAADLRKKLEEYEKEKQARLDAERTELEKEQARRAALEADLEKYKSDLTKAQMGTLFERELSKRLAGMDDKQRELKRMLYEAAVIKSDGFADEDSLKLILDPVDELLKGEAPGQRVIQNPGSAQQAAPSGKWKDMFDMSPDELRKAAKNRSK